MLAVASPKFVFTLLIFLPFVSDAVSAEETSIQ